MPATKAATEPRPITKTEIDEVINLHRGLLRMTLVRQIEIGEKLVGMKERVPSGKWAKWLNQNLPEIGQASAGRYIRLFNNRAALEKKFKIKFAGLEKVSPKDIPVGFPTSKEADKFLRERDQNKPRGNEVAKARARVSEDIKNGNGQAAKSEQAKSGQIVKYTLQMFAKEIGAAVNNAKAAGIPLLTICDTLGAAHSELVKMCKAKEVKVKAA